MWLLKRSQVSVVSIVFCVYLLCTFVAVCNAMFDWGGTGKITNAKYHLSSLTFCWLDKSASDNMTLFLRLTWYFLALSLWLGALSELIYHQLGTGKTATFAIGILQKLDMSSGVKDCQALVLAPTRELAQQIVKVRLLFICGVCLLFSFFHSLCRWLARLVTSCQSEPMPA